VSRPALITPRLDYCNSMFAGLRLPQSTLQPLQLMHSPQCRGLELMVQNAVRLVFDLRHRDHVSQYLMELHWLPVRWSRVQFTLCTLMHAIHNKDLRRRPLYLRHSVQTVATTTTRCGLRSTATIRTMSCRVHFPS